MFQATSGDDRIAAAQNFLSGQRLDEAEALLTEVLSADPAHPDALNGLGGVALARRDTDRASRILGAAATAFPDHVGIVNNLGIAHQMMGRMDEAIHCFERAAALAPALDAPLHSLAMARFLNNDPAGAAEVADAILARSPGAAAAIGMLGLVALGAGDRERAESALSRALALEPDNPVHLRALSVCYAGQGRLDEALHLAERARLASPLDVDTLEHLVRCLAEAGRHGEAEAHCRKILAFAPDHLPVIEMLARMMILRGEVDAGLAQLTKAVRAAPKSTAALMALATTARFAGRLAQALPLVDHALKLEPANTAAQVLKSEIALAGGDFPETVDASPLPSRIVVPGALGASEFILFSRFLQKLGDDGAPVSVVADQRYAPILAHLRTPIALSPPDAAEPALALPALMRRFDLDAARVGALAPYLRPDAERQAIWRAALDEHPRPWIGVVWEGSLGGFGLAELRASLPLAGSAVSLMTGDTRHDLRDWPEAIDAGLHVSGFEDLIALIANLDFVVGPDVAAMHLSGALGRPGLVMVAAGHPWYWASAHGRSIWYPSLAVEKQARPGRWPALGGLVEEHFGKHPESLRESGELFSPGF